MAEFSKEIYYGFILRGDLRGLLGYLRQFPEQTELCERFAAVFERAQYVDYPISGALNGILRQYQRYFRDVFYLGFDRAQAAEQLRRGLTGLLGMTTDIPLDDLEQQHIPPAFERGGLHFLGGRTSGYYGPYVWRTTTPASYAVELPEGVQRYTVNLLDGFLLCSHLDYLSFGEITPGGWTDGDGVIHCVKASYDLGSEAFQVSLLKHEAQHAMDLARNSTLSSAVLEYRAKLVELIYSHERRLLPEFAQQADASDPANGHSLAADKIIRGFTEKSGKTPDALVSMPLPQVREIALSLFEDSAALLTG